MRVSYRFRSDDYAYTTQLKLTNLIGYRPVNRQLSYDRPNKCRVMTLDYQIPHEEALRAQELLSKHFEGVLPHQRIEVQL